MNADMSLWIFDTMISMTLLMAVVLLIRKPVRHYFGAKIAYALWALPVARLFMPVLTLEAPAPVHTPAEAATTSPAAIQAMNDIVLSAPAQQASAGALTSVDWFTIAMIVWFGGAGMLFISKLASYVQFREDIVSDGQLVGRHGKIRILETAAVGGPLAFGLFQKYIAVPTDFFRNYSPKERELALEHEIAHHESGDLAANFAGLLILSLHWFNPIAWFAWVAFREDQETACDARILKQSGQEVRAIYGRTIAKSASGHQLGLASPLNQKDKIKGRLKMLGQREKSGFRKKVGMLMVGASTVVALPLTATVVYAEAEAAEEAHPAEHNGGVKIQKAGTTVNVGDDGVLVTEKTKGGYKYTVSNKRGTYEFVSKRKLKKNEIDKKLSGMVPSYKKMNMVETPAAPAWPEPVSTDSDDNVINITMLNGSKDFANDKQYVHRIKHDGRTIVLRTNRKLSDTEVREQVAEAEESRLEADADLREHKREMRMDMREVEREVEEAKREALLATGNGWHRGPDGKVHRHNGKRETAAKSGALQRQIEREVEREVEKARREVEHEMRDVQREVERSVREAERAARISASVSQRQSNRTNRKTSRVWSIANQVAEISFAPRAPRKSHSRHAKASQPDCTAMNKKIAFGGQKGGMTDAAWALVAGCGNFEVKVDEKQLMKVTLRGMERDYKEAKACKDKSKAHKNKLRAYDRDIKKLKSRLSMT